jgi:hypothetical protein
MKTIFVFALMILVSQAWATVRTVSNNPATLGQFNTIQTAIDASADGDTVYVYGSPNTYAGFTVLDKQVTVIGPGWAPDKNLPHNANVSGAVIRNSPAGGSPDGTEFQGLIFVSDVYASRNQVSGDIPVNNVRLIRCQFNAGMHWEIGATGFLIESCVSHGVMYFNPSSTYENFLFQNNMIMNYNTPKVNNLFNTVNVRFDHNLFYSTNNGGGGTYQTFNNCRFLTITNNIFNQTNAGLGLSFSTFNNNITNNITLNSGNATSNATPWAVNSNVDGGGNVSNQSPVLTDQTAVNAGNSSPLLNFTIASGPANNSGSDGKDMGLLFDATGSLNWTNCRNSRLPRIFSMNITTPTVAPGGNISVSVDARKSN